MSDNGGERMYPLSLPEMGISAAPHAVVKRHLQRYIQAVSEIDGMGGDWLDVACGSGYGSSVVRKRFPNSYHGVDYDPTAISYARKLFGKNGTFECADLVDWAPPPDKGPFDVILCIETLEHLPQCRQSRFIARLMNLLKPEGKIVVTCPVGDGGPIVNPWHAYEPTIHDLCGYLGPSTDKLYTETVEGTFGPFKQAYAVAWR